MITKALLSISSSALLCLSLIAGCSAAPDGSATDVAADASSASPEEQGGPGEVGHETIVRGPILCEPAACNTACAKEPGVAGGSCEASLCVCDAPTCGQLDQTPCAGNYCSQGHYDAWLNLCDSCGTNGATCCDYQHAGATTSCYDGLQCLNGFSCGACGAAGQPLCPNGYCNSGLVLALAPGQPQWGPPAEVGVCESACGLVGQLPCWEYYTDDSGCTQQDAEVLPGSPDCQWNPSCGHLGQGCCDAGSFFQTPNYDTDLCHDGSVCAYEGTWGFGSWQCVSPSSGGSSGGGGCDDSCDPCGDDDCNPCDECDEVKRAAWQKAHGEAPAR
jgi:hypothetical protein